MHNLALALYYNHHTVTGSDDEIYNPARDRLQKRGLLPAKEGWFPDKITADIDVVILGMHARPDNPELKKALDLKLRVLSYPEFIYEHSKDKKRVVVAGSHGKTTTTSMILHVLKSIDPTSYKKDMRFDYLVGAQLEGFERMVQLSDAPIMVIEGDEYLSSPIDRRPKFLHYKPHISIITGVAWDHINVFPTFENYVSQFGLFLKSIPKAGKVFYYGKDKHLKKLVKELPKLKALSYQGFDSRITKGETILLTDRNKEVPLKMKKLPKITKKDIQTAFAHPNLKVFTDNQKFQKYLKKQKWADQNLLLMTSGTYNGLDLQELVDGLEIGD